MRQKKAVLAYSFSAKNAGDFSLTIAAINLLLENNFTITIISRFEENTEEYQDTKKFIHAHYPNNEITLVETPFQLDRTTNFVKRGINSVKGYLTSVNVLKKDYIDNVIKNADAVFLCAGNLLRCGSYKDYMRLTALNYPLKLAKKYKRKYFILPQSSSEIKVYGRALLGEMMNDAETVFTREDLSFEKLQEYYPNANIVPSIDIAFFLLDKELFKPNNTFPKIAFTIRGDGIGGLSELKTSDKKLISNKIEGIVHNYEKKAKITFIIQGTASDRKITKELSNNLSVKFQMDISVIEEHDTHKLMKLYSEYDILIGMRLHSIILASVAGTPSYGLFLKEWGLKNPGILNLMKLPYTIIDKPEPIDFGQIDKVMSNKDDFQKVIVDLIQKEKKKFKGILRDRMGE